MSAPSPMEISLQNPQDNEIPDQNGVIAVDSAPSPSLPHDKVLVSGPFDFVFIILSFKLFQFEVVLMI